ncbi:MAG TPA: ABC transporter permease [Rhizomicrobium sp.]|nr:ABC transporter permease [Rhizomicrobium sp.]
MKFLPLIWSAIMRKPARAVLTLLSVVMAFTLFGLTIGLNATFNAIEQTSRADRIFVNPRFGEPLPIAMGRQVVAIPGVAQVGAIGALFGYHQEKKNNVFVMMVDDNLRKVRPDWPLSAAQWDMIAHNRTGIVISRITATRWHLNTGSDFVLAAPSIPKADGTSSWNLHVLAVVDDLPAWGNGFMMGNFDYFDKARPVADQGKADWFEALANDPDQAAEVGKRIVARFANSATPLQTITEKAAYQSSGSGLDLMAVTRGVAVIGLCMILFLSANVIAQSVRERFAEFATLKTIGFSDPAVLALVVLEAAVPCVLGALLGVGVAAAFAKLMPRLFPPGFGIPVPTMTPMVFAWALLSAIIVALGSSALPVLRLKRMDIATALARR